MVNITEAQLSLIAKLLKVAECPNCDGSGAIPNQVRSRKYVSREMALDAGMPELEGSLYLEREYKSIECQFCSERKGLLKDINDELQKLR